MKSILPTAGLVTLLFSSPLAAQQEHSQPNGLEHLYEALAHKTHVHKFHAHTARVGPEPTITHYNPLHHTFAYTTYKRTGLRIDLTVGHEYNGFDTHHPRHTEFGFSVQLKRPH